MTPAQTEEKRFTQDYIVHCLFRFSHFLFYFKISMIGTHEL